LAEVSVVFRLSSAGEKDTKKTTTKKTATTKKKKTKQTNKQTKKRIIFQVVFVLSSAERLIFIFSRSKFWTDANEWYTHS